MFNRIGRDMTQLEVGATGFMDLGLIQLLFEALEGYIYVARICYFTLS